MVSANSITLRDIIRLIWRQPSEFLSLRHDLLSARCRGSLPSALLLAHKVNLLQKQGGEDVEKGKESWMFHCNAPFIRCEVIPCASSETVPILRMSAKVCQLGKKLVVHREISVSAKLIRHSMFLWKRISFFSFLFFLLRDKMFLLFGHAGKIKIDFPEITCFQWRN